MIRLSQLGYLGYVSRSRSHSLKQAQFDGSLLDGDTVSHSSMVHCQMEPLSLIVPWFTARWHHCHSQFHGLLLDGATVTHSSMVHCQMAPLSLPDTFQTPSRHPPGGWLEQREIMLSQANLAELELGLSLAILGSSSHTCLLHRLHSVPPQSTELSRNCGDQFSTYSSLGTPGYYRQGVAPSSHSLEESSPTNPFIHQKSHLLTHLGECVP